MATSLVKKMIHEFEYLWYLIIFYLYHSVISGKTPEKVIPDSVFEQLRFSRVLSSDSSWLEEDGYDF